MLRNFYLDKTPWFIPYLFKNYQWNYPSEEKVIYLTFDDGPTPGITSYVLDILARYDIRATFFCLGKNVVRHPILYNRIIEEKHHIGNHTFNHLNDFNVSTADYYKDVQRAHKFLNSNLFRPPYGRITRSTSRRLRESDYTIIMWDVLAGDFDTTRSSQSCLKNLKQNTKPGSIVVLHDSLKAQKKVQDLLVPFISYFLEKGYNFKPIPYPEKQKKN